jgi:thiol:disulfide interchange protein DsbC
MTEHPVSESWLDLGDLRRVAVGILALALLAAVLPVSAQDRPDRPDRPERRAAAVVGESRHTRDTQSAQAFATRLRTLFPETRIDEVIATETPGLFEVVMGPNIAYIDASGRYWTFGHRYDMVERRDMTAPRLAVAGKVDVASLPLDAALKTVKGNGQRVLHVFADPNCGYCKQFEHSLSQVKDVTVYTYLLPILSQDSVAKAAAIWCATDRVEAWRAWMLDGLVPAKAQDCVTPTDQVMALARSLRIDATPTLIAADGRKAPGAMPAEELMAWLDAGATPVAERKTSIKAMKPQN